MNVAIAIIYDQEQRILITQRASNTPQGGLWEFPGGKLEAQETPAEALIREIKEEVDLEITKYEFLSQIDAELNASTLSLFVFLVHQYNGEARCLETQQNLRWVPKNDLSLFQFPNTNQAIIEWVVQEMSLT